MSAHRVERQYLVARDHTDTVCMYTQQSTCTANQWVSSGRELCWYIPLLQILLPFPRYLEAVSLEYLRDPQRDTLGGATLSLHHNSILK